ncbi:MAG: hypothetical protein IPK64_19130 [bacterium]|nr:hypothetical protein [bacterium]
MASENWQERLEAYLDGELDAAATAAFDAETAASPARQAELAARQRFGALAREVLRGEATAAAVPAPATRRARDAGRRRIRITAAAAVAAALGLLLLAPPLVRRPASVPALRGGPVVALRFGEIPGATAVLESGCYDQATGTVR